MSKRRWIALALIFLVCGGLVVCVVLSNRDRFPAAPELAGVDLSLAPNPPPLESLARVVATGEAEATLGDDLLRDARDAIGSQRWPRDGEALLEAIAQRLKPGVARLYRTLLEPGCLPPTSVPGVPSQFDHLVLYRKIELLVFRVVALAQTGRVKQALTELEALQRRLLALEQECAHVLLPTMIVEESLRWVLRAWGFVLAIPETPDRQLQPRVWPRVRALVLRANPMPGAMRREHQFMTRAFEDLLESEAPGSGTAAAWPWFDAEQTRQVHDQISRRLVWLAELEATSKALVEKTPEELFFERLNGQPAWHRHFRFNHAGLVMLASTLTVQRGFVTRWHLRRCRRAAQHARWIANIQSRGRVLDPRAVSPAPKNPYTGRPFGPGLAREDLRSPCAPPWQAEAPMGLVDVHDLPPPPAEEAAPSSRPVPHGERGP